MRLDSFEDAANKENVSAPSQAVRLEKLWFHFQTIFWMKFM